MGAGSRVRPVGHSRGASRGPVVRVGLLGLGTVGAGVAEILARHGALMGQRAGVEVLVVRALVRSRRRRRRGAGAAIPLTTQASEVVQAPDVDIVVELLGGQEPARQLMVQALGSPQAYNMYTFAKGFEPTDLRLIFAGPGTFWTDLKSFPELTAGQELQGQTTKK